MVVIATWAVYLTLHVTRRREHLATARNVDRFSEHMRVLQRRAVRNAPRTRLKTSVHLLRTAEPGRRLVTESVPEVSGPGGEAPGGTLDAQHSGWPVVEELGRPAEDSWPVDSLPEDSPLGESAPIGLTWPFAVLGGLTAFSTRTFRTAALIGLVTVTALVAALVALRALPWWILVVAVACVGALVMWLPRAAAAERIARDRRRQARRYLHPRARRRLLTELAASGPGDVTAAARPAAHPEAEAAPSDAATPDGAVTPDEVAPAPVGSDAPVAASRPATAPRRGSDRPFDVLGDGGGWTPVPVPPATYTLKARAPHEVPVAPARVAPRQGRGHPVPVPIEVEDDFDSWAPVTSRHAVGS